MTLSLPEWKGDRVAPATFEVPITIPEPSDKTEGKEGRKAAALLGQDGELGDEEDPPSLVTLQMNGQVYDARVLAASADFDQVFRRLLSATEWRGPLLFLEASFKGTPPSKNAAGQRKARDILGADRLAIEVEFPHRNAKEKPVRVTGYLHPDTCCGKSLEA